MKIVTWNVAGFRAALKKGFETYFDNIDADIFCLNEVKATKDQYNFDKKDYYEYLNPAERKGYSGVLVYTKIKPLNVFYGMDKIQHDTEGRMITLEYDDFYLISVYVPNVKRDLSRLEYRMKWEDDFLEYAKSLEKTKPVIICGDMNVAHKEIDLKNPKTNIGNAGFTNEEREKFTKLLNSGFIDAFRYLYPNKLDAYSWWSYRRNVREKNIGWRIDYFLTSSILKDKIEDVKIRNDIFGSDHCPVELEIAIKEEVNN